MLGGVTRMVLSLTVIILESSEDIGYGLPLLLVFITARFVGNVFNLGLYDMHIELRRVPFLEWNPPKWFRRLRVRHIMTPYEKLQTVRTVEKASRILELLQHTSHSAFPVTVTHMGKRTLAGIVMRKHLCVLLSTQYKARTLKPRHAVRERATFAWLHRSLHGLAKAKTAADAALPWKAFEALYPRYVSASTLSLTEKERALYVDLSPYMGMPYTVQQRASLARAFQVRAVRAWRPAWGCVVGVPGA